MMDRNDPRLTAYALGEMDEAERSEFEKALASDPAAQAEVDAIRALGGRLRTELAGATAPALTDAQRASVAQAAARRRVPLAILLMPVAACLFAAVAILFWDRPEPTRKARYERAETAAERDRRDEQVHLESARNQQARATEELAPRVYRGPNGGVAPGARVPSDPEPPAPQPAGPPSPSEPGIVTAGTPVEKPMERNERLSEQEALGGAPAPKQTTGRGDGGPTTPAPEELPVPARAPATKKKEDELLAAPGRAGDETARSLANKLIAEAELHDGRFRDDPRYAKVLEELTRELDLLNRGGPGSERVRKNLEAIGRELEHLSREGYSRIRENPFVRVSEEDSSTFGIDVDTASYANVRRFLLNENRLPPPDAVRVEEMINYFSYGYEPPHAGSPDPFRIHVEVAQCPWNTSHRLARVAIQGKVIDHRERPASNLVFLVDVSGSMNEPNKLPLVQASLRMLAENLGERDRVALVVYAGSAGLVLPSTGDKREVIAAIERLRAGGSTAGAAGIQLAYETAAASFLKEGVNRVILCTDGDFNVGISDDGSLTRFIEEKAKTGVFLSVLGFGTGNYQDAKMQQLADRGNGNHAYIDSILEARKVLGEEMSGTLVTIAKDVKIQVFFNPRRVASFRLIGYENRLLAKQDFNDDTKDAGEIGAGHSVTALYELVLAGSEVGAAPAVDENPFVARAQAANGSDALFQLRLRYKQPDGDTSKLLESLVHDDGKSFDGASAGFRWAGAVAAFGMALRDAKSLGLDAILEIAKGTAGDDKYRLEFLKLVETAKLLRR